ncbi:MAG: hypothetical protein ACJZ03_00390 [Candidatus Neomarinimicrobiota bacterium]|tara:strand:- start:10023 stop:10604 length:582 start_codon:yes stop_codon:yes gene_type:complete
MFKFLLIILFFNFSYSEVLFSKFINQNKIFLNNSIQSIQFDYSIHNLDSTLNEGPGRLLISKDKYKLILKNHIFMLNEFTFKRYNKKTNQVFIENNNFEIDALVLDFFKIENLESIQIDNNGIISSLPSNLNINNLVIKLDFSIDSSEIKNINIQSNEYIVSLNNLYFSNEIKIINNPFSFNFPNSFTFDLRD